MRTQQLFVCSVLCFLLAALRQLDALVILSPAALKGTRLNTPRILPHVYGFTPVQGSVLDSSLNGTCGELNGFIVLLQNSTTDSNPLQKTAIRLQECGAKGLIFWDRFSDFAGSVTAFRTEESQYVRIPMLSVGKSDGELLSRGIINAAASGTFVFVDLSGSENDVNFWELWSENGVGYALQALMVLFCGTVSGIGGAKLLAFIRNRGFSIRSVPQAVLIIRILTNLYRLIYFAIDPLFLGRVLSNRAALSMFNVSIPFDIVGTLIIAFYWHEILNRKSAFRLDFIDNMTIPVAVVSVVLIAMELTLVILRLTLDNVPVASYVTGGAYLTAAIVIGVYFLVVGLFLVSFLRKGTAVSSNERSAKVLRRTTISLVALSLCNLLLAASILVSAFPIFLSNPFVFRSILLLQSIAVTLCGLVSVLSIRAPFSKDLSGVNEPGKARSPRGCDTTNMDTVDSSQHVRFQTSKSSTALSSSALSTVDTVVVNSDDGE